MSLGRPPSGAVPALLVMLVLLAVLVFAIGRPPSTGLSRPAMRVLEHGRALPPS